MSREDSKKNIVILSGVVILMLLFCAYRFIDNSQGNEYTKMKQDAETIMKGIKTGDYELMQEIFSPYVRKKYLDLQNDIAELLECMGEHSIPEGWVEKKLRGDIDHIKTSNKKTYDIKFGGYYIYRDKPEKVGVRYIMIR